MIETSAQDLARLWQEIGLQPGQMVLCHSFMPSVGRVSPGPDTVVETLIEAIGPDGTLIAPTFTYSYFRGEVYDVENSPSTVGVLGDIVRKWPGAVRSLEPNFSMAAVGGRAGELMARDVPNPFGEGGYYDKLLKAEGFALLLGVDFTALPLFMHLEFINQVVYRYEKEFKGTTCHQGKKYQDKAVHFVRDEKLNPESYRSRVGAVIDQEQDCKKVKFAYGEHRLVPLKTVARVVAQCLAQDPFFLIKSPV
jgi:aminoglycoside 3-N-acetyltransferase